MSNLPSDFDLLRSFDYTDRDFDTIYSRLQDLVVSVWPTWGKVKASWDNYLLGLMAHASDTVHFYRDNRLRESFLATAKLRESVILLGQLVDYELFGPIPATVDLTFILSAPAAGNVTIPEGTVAETSGRLKLAFQTTADLVILAGNLTGTVGGENSTARTEERTSDGTADQRLLLTYRNMIDGSMEITAANGAYTEVDNFLSSGSTERHFTLAADTQGRPIVTFGDGTNGEIPTGTITFGYNTGGGRVGRVEANTITRVRGGFTDSLGNAVSVSVNNATEAVGGEDMESIAHAKKAIPASLGNVRTTVSWDDFKANAELVPGVSRAVILTADQDPSIPENTGRLYVCAAGTPYDSGYSPPATPSAVTLAAVETMIESTRPHTITFDPTYLPVVFKEIDHVVTAYFLQGYDPEEVAADMLDRLRDFYAVTDATGAQQDNARFGFEYVDNDGDVTGELPWSDVFDVLRDTEGVRKIEAAGGLYLNGLVAGVLLGTVQFPRIRSLIVYDGDTGVQVL